VKTWIPKAVVILAIAIYVGSLTQRAFYVDNPHVWNDPAIFPLVIGWLGIFQGVVAWYANPLLFVAWVLFFIGMRRLATAFLVGAFVLAVSFLSVKSLQASDAPTYTDVTGYGAGYFLWLASIFVSAIGALMPARKVESHNQASEPAPPAHQ
jgi:hypothetical protein